MVAQSIIFGEHRIAKVHSGELFRIEIQSTSVKDERYELTVEEGLTPVSPAGEKLFASREILDGLVGIAVSSFDADDDGSSTLLLSNGIRLRCPPGDRYESWQLVGPHGLRWIGGPDGTVTRWSPTG